MNQLTFLDKINILFKMLFSSPVIIGIFVFSMILMILLFFYSKLNKKIMKFIFIIIYVALIGFAIIKYGSYFITSVDSFVTLFMANIYFPVLPFYVVIMFISFIIMVVSLNNKNKHKLVKIINTIFFTLIQMLFVLFVYIVETNKIDLSENTNLYTNEQTMTLLELGMGLFFVWMIVIFIIFYLKKADKIFRVKKSDDSDDFDEYINDYNEPSNNLNNISNVSNSTVSSVSESSVQSSPIPVLVESNFIQPELVPISNLSDNHIKDKSIDIQDHNLEDEVVIFDDFDYESLKSNNVEDLSNSNFSINLSDSDLSTSEQVNNMSNVSNNMLSGMDSLKNNGISNNSGIDIFNNFNFLNVSNHVERKNEDVEIIDFDS